MRQASPSVKWVFFGVFLSIALVGISLTTDLTQLLKIERTDSGSKVQKTLITAGTRLEDVDWYSEDPYAVGDQRGHPSADKPKGDINDSEDIVDGDVDGGDGGEDLVNEEEDMPDTRTVVSPGSLSDEEVKAAFRSAVRYGLKGVNMSFYPRFKAAQIQLVRALNTLRNASMVADPSKRKPLRLLIVVTVSSKLSSVASFVEWVQYFDKVQARQKSLKFEPDTFHFALNHYDNTLVNW